MSKMPKLCLHKTGDLTLLIVTHFSAAEKQFKSLLNLSTKTNVQLIKLGLGTIFTRIGT